MLHFAALMCGPVRSQPGGPVEEIVVSGGYKSGYLSKVEVYNVQEDSWETGRTKKDTIKILKLPVHFVLPPQYQSLRMCLWFKGQKSY